MAYNHPYKTHLKGGIGRTYCGLPLWKSALREMLRLQIKDVNCKSCKRRYAALNKESN